MTAQLERPVTMSEEMRRFEEFDKANPDYHAEMIDGEVYFETVVTAPHGNMVMTIGSQLVSKWFIMTEVDTVYDGWHGKTLLRPDFSVADPSYRGTRLKKFPADEIILVGEVVSESNPENDTHRKVGKYAQAGIPYYLIVNPIEGQCLLYSLPAEGRYRSRVESKFGDPVPVGAPLDIEIDTTALYTY
ncbi:Uma2 family endonuclease [Streptomyces sp. NPDC001407]|uniref:Uma2 family endonuclease n=1 Tax=unclassified Streptomyces TaxID=2593676 RepID=UPI0033C11D87